MLTGDDSGDPVGGVVGGGVLGDGVTGEGLTEHSSQPEQYDAQSHLDTPAPVHGTSESGTVPSV